jgi:hypothetical protein
MTRSTSCHEGGNDGPENEGSGMKALAASQQHPKRH